MDSLKLYIRSFLIEVQSQVEYKLSFILNLISQIFVFFTYYFLLISLFQIFNNIKGFTLYEVLLCFSIINIGFSFNETFFRGLDKFDSLIIDGSFDRLLLRPRNILFQVICSKMEIIKIFRMLQAFILMIVASIAIFFIVFLFAASYCFYTIQGLEIRNLLTNGGKHMAQYPIGIFNKKFIFIFTFIIPYAFVNYYPLLFLIGKSNNNYLAFSPLITLLYFIPAYILFNISRKKYTSSGS